MLLGLLQGLPKLARQFFVPGENIEVRGVVADGRLITWRIEVMGKKAGNFEQMEKGSGNSGSLLSGIAKLRKRFLGIF